MRDFTWKVLRHISGRNDLTSLAKLAPEHELTQKQIDGLVEELATSQMLRDAVAKYGHLSHDKVTDLSIKLAATGKSTILMLYALLRIMKPKTVIETGCFTGYYSAIILYAMHMNSDGHLYTIDLPAKAGNFDLQWGLPEGVGPGFLVPDDLRYRWTLTIGNVRDELLPLLNRLGQIEGFFHDSDHSYQHMMWEFTSMWPHLRKGGVLISDDISFNTSFRDFSIAMRSAYVIHKSSANFGALVKA